jgi:hypothetical protein
MGKTIAWRCPIAVVLLVGIFSFIPALCLAQSSPGYVLGAYALSGGGAGAVSANFNLTATLGQASPLGACAGENYVHQAGFWYAVGLKKMLYLPLILQE